MKKFVFLLFYLILTFTLSAQNQIKTTSVNLNLRTNPIIGKNVICVIPKGAILSVDYTNQEYNDWIKVNYNSRIGYVYSNYIKDPELVNSYKHADYNHNSSGSSIKYYKNSRGEKVQSPTYYSNPPAGATAICRDGTYSFSRSRRGTCSHHGGVLKWL